VCPEKRRLLHKDEHKEIYIPTGFTHPQERGTPHLPEEKNPRGEKPKAPPRERETKKGPRPKDGEPPLYGSRVDTGGPTKPSLGERKKPFKETARDQGRKPRRDKETFPELKPTSKK